MSGHPPLPRRGPRRQKATPNQGPPHPSQRVAQSRQSPCNLRCTAVLLRNRFRKRTGGCRSCRGGHRLQGPTPPIGQRSTPSLQRLRGWPPRLQRPAPSEAVFQSQARRTAREGERFRQHSWLLPLAARRAQRSTMFRRSSKPPRLGRRRVQPLASVDLNWTAMPRRRFPQRR